MVRSSDTNDVIAVQSLRDYFRRTVEASVQRQGVDLEPQAEHYVVNLLTLFSRSEDLFEDHGDYYGLAPLATMLAAATEARTSEERSAQLQRLGDVALFVAGCWFDSLHETAVDHQYYIRMGGGAYSSLSDSLGTSTRQAALASVFAELAQKFQPLVDVLQDVCERGSSSRDSNLLKVYAYWQRTGSKRAYAELVANNIRPIESAHKFRSH
ncbi:MAG: hypothetical protein AAGH76_06970 [Pseudomonadota bacterium]